MTDLAALEMMHLHKDEVSDLEFLLLAINAGDPVQELRIRVEDILRRKVTMIAKLEGRK